MSAYAVVGPERHGVVIHALRLAGAAPDLGAGLVRISATDPATVATDLRLALAGHDSAMIHVTDHLLGSSPSDAADLVEDLARTTALALCLHDIPQPEEGEARHARRRAAYRRFVESAAVVVVASEHERALLDRCLDGDSPDTPVVVLPLPVERMHGAAPERQVSRQTAPHVGVLGFLYPGKGLEDVIDAAAGAAGPGREITVVNVGGVSRGHESMVDDLTTRALERGIRFVVSGYVPDRDLTRALWDVDVPVAAHRHVSASGSINTWIAVGRRPILLDGDYTRELATRMPGAVTVVEGAAGLAAAIGSALDHPGSTWIDDAVVLTPTWAASAADHEAVLRSVS